jgi:hypothetical protein
MLGLLQPCRVAGSAAPVRSGRLHHNPSRESFELKSVLVSHWGEPGKPAGEVPESIVALPSGSIRFGRCVGFTPFPVERDFVRREPATALLPDELRRPAIVERCNVPAWRMGQGGATRQVGESADRSGGRMRRRTGFPLGRGDSSSRCTPRSF